MYHLDALVFSNKLLEWCATDLDYIAAPWVKHVDAPYHGMARIEGKVGNSGFSLRKISSFLKIIESCRKSENSQSWYKKTVRKLKDLLKGRGIVKSAESEMDLYPFNDDVFWANRAIHYYPDFKIASVEVALQFAFECVPRYCFDLSGERLPFGCHAWARYDREFWEPYLLK
jgi:hypothetical protein